MSEHLTSCYRLAIALCAAGELPLALLQAGISQPHVYSTASVLVFLLL